MNDSFKLKYDSYLQVIERELEPLLASGTYSLNDNVYAAARYSLLAGGKRIRPVLLLSAAEVFEADLSYAVRLACAIEMIHTYSLIHDDLPCMDNDDLRRGKPTCHKVYGEAVAVLAGDALLNRAYELILDTVSADLPETLAAGKALAAAAGLNGMIAGQSMDIAAETVRLDITELAKLHSKKTGALIKASLISAARLAAADEHSVNLLSGYADAIGLAFQIQDDILDVTSDNSQLGKTTGKDARDHKSTYVTLLGLEGAKEKLHESDQEARKFLAELAMAGYDINFLYEMTDFLLLRKF
jgi:geranylgeranyl diphosphate synthase type II